MNVMCKMQFKHSCADAKEHLLHLRSENPALRMRFRAWKKDRLIKRS